MQNTRNPTGIHVMYTFAICKPNNARSYASSDDCSSHMSRLVKDAQGDLELYFSHLS